MSNGAVIAARFDAAVNVHGLSLPHDDRAEAGVIGSILIDPSCFGAASELAQPADFFDQANAAIFRQMAALEREGQPIDSTLLLSRLNAIDSSQPWAGTLGELQRQTPTHVHVEHYAGIVRDLSERRQLIHTAEDVLASAKGGAITAQLAEIMRDCLEGTANSDPRSVRVKGIAELVSEYPQLNAPAIDGLLRRGETCNIIAAPKVGKSWLAYALALMIVTGGWWLDRFKCTPGRILILDNELHPSLLAHRIPAVAGAMGLPESAYRDRLDVVPLRGRQTDLLGMSRMINSLANRSYTAVILDAFYRGLPGGTSENDNAAITHAFNCLDRYADRLDACWINIHHASKGSQADKSVTDVGSGAGAQSRAADTHLVLRPHEQEGCVVLEAVVRSFAPVEPMVLRWGFPLWTWDGQLDPEALKGRKPAVGKRQERLDQEGMYKLLNALAAGPATESQLRTRAKMGPERMDRLMAVLVERQEVTIRDIRANGNDCLEYRRADVVC